MNQKGNETDQDSTRIECCNTRQLAAEAGRNRLGELAVEENFCTPKVLEEALEEQEAHPARLLGQILVRRQVLTPAQLVRLMELQSPILRRLGKYAIEGVLGEGIMGVVFQARDMELGRRVALKILRKGALLGFDSMGHFRKESRIASKLFHPNIIPLLEAGQWGDFLYLAMPVVGGETLTQWIRSDERTHSQIIGMVRKVARAVHYMHEQGVIHLDLKPDNILVDEQGEPHLCDFSLSRHLGDEKVKGQVVGTPAYMAPEQMPGEHEPLDEKCDIYSLGVILYQMLSGVLPPMTQTVPARLSENEALDRVSFKALQKDPAQRHESALAFAEDLEKAAWFNPPAPTRLGRQRTEFSFRRRGSL